MHYNVTCKSYIYIYIHTMRDIETNLHFGHTGLNLKIDFTVKRVLTTHIQQELLKVAQRLKGMENYIFALKIEILKTTSYTRHIICLETLT